MSGDVFVTDRDYVVPYDVVKEINKEKQDERPSGSNHAGGEDGARGLYVERGPVAR